MNVKLVSITESLVQIGGEDKKLSAEELLVYIARVSSPANQGNTDTAERLLAYLIKNKHWSPFDMINVTFEVKTSKAIAIQILRHWSIKPQEFSQRYAEVTDIEPIDFRLSAVKNRQSSTETVGEITRIPEDFGEEFVAMTPADNAPSEIIADYLGRVAKNLTTTMELYKEGLQLGIAKECARMILPMATSTTMYLNGSVRSWLFYLSQRLDAHAQLEHREVAQLVEQLFKEHFPNTHKAFFNGQ